MTLPETSESKTALDILTENVRKSETVEIVQTLTIDPNSSLNSQAQRKDTGQWLEENLQEDVPKKSFKFGEPMQDDNLYMLQYQSHADTRGDTGLPTQEFVTQETTAPMNQDSTLEQEPG